MEERQILFEIHQMLCRICNYLDKVESSEYRDMEDKRAFNINVAADLYADKIKELRDDLLDRKH